MNAEGEGLPTLAIFYHHPAPSSLDPMSRPRRGGGGGRNAVSLEKECYFPACTSLQRNPGCRWGLSAGPFYSVHVARRPCSSTGRESPATPHLELCHPASPGVHPHRAQHPEPGCACTSCITFLYGLLQPSLLHIYLTLWFEGAQLGLHRSTVVFNLPASRWCVCGWLRPSSFWR